MPGWKQDFSIMELANQSSRNMRTRSRKLVNHTLLLKATAFLPTNGLMEKCFCPSETIKFAAIKQNLRQILNKNQGRSIPFLKVQLTLYEMKRLSPDTNKLDIFADGKIAYLSCERFLEGIILSPEE